MSETVATSTTASELIGEPAPPKKTRPKLPPGVTVQPVRPGATWGIHPVDGLGIRLTDAKALETPGEAPAPTPDKPPTPPAPTPPIELSPAPEKPSAPQAPPASPEPVPLVTEEKPGPSKPAPDFSDLPKSDGPGPAPGGNEQPSGNPADALKSHKALGEIVHRMIEMFCVMIFGTDFQTSDGERNALIQAWADAFDWWQIRVLNPAERLAAAYSAYFFARIGAVIAWFKNRKSKKPTPQPPQPEQAPIDVQSKVTPEPEKKSEPANTADKNSPFFA